MIPIEQSQAIWNLNQISESQPNFRISTKFQNLNQISESGPNLRIFELYQISGFWPNFWISTKFKNVDPPPFPPSSSTWKLTKLACFRVFQFCQDVLWNISWVHAHCRTTFFSFDTGRNYFSADCHWENKSGPIQVIDSIPWVRCASGNVCCKYVKLCHFFRKMLKYGIFVAKH